MQLWNRIGRSGLFRAGRVTAKLVAAVVILALAAGIWMTGPVPTTYAAVPAEGSVTGVVGSGGVTKGLFVKWSGTTIVLATAATDSVIGVAEQTGAQNAMVRFAPMGTFATVTSGALITKGDLVTCNASSKAITLTSSSVASQRMCGVAITGAASADLDVTVYIAPGYLQAQIDPTTDLTVAANKNLTLAAGTGYFQANGSVSGAIKIAPIATGTATATIVNQNQAATTVTLPNATGTLAILGANTFTGAQTFGAGILASGAVANDFSTGSGTFLTSTGANTPSGDVTVANGKNFGQTGTGTFTTGTGAVTLSGDTTVAAGKNLLLAAGAGYFQANGTTSGAIKIAPIAVGTATATIVNQNVAASTVTLPSATCTLPGLGLANTWSGINTFGTAASVFSIMPTIPATTASSAGTVQGDATAITTGFTVVNGSTNAGVRLPAASNGAIAIVKYTATGNLKIYPAGSDAINALGASNPLTIAAPVCTMLVCQGTTWYTMPVVPS